MTRLLTLTFGETTSMLQVTLDAGMLRELYQRLGNRQ